MIKKKEILIKPTLVNNLFYDLISNDKLEDHIANIRIKTKIRNETACSNHYDVLSFEYSHLLMETIHYIPNLYQKKLWKAAYVTIYSFYYLLHSFIKSSNLCNLASDVFEKKELSKLEHIFFVGNLTQSTQNQKHAFFLVPSFSKLMKELSDPDEFKKSQSFLLRAKAIENLEKLNIDFETWHDLCETYKNLSQLLLMEVIARQYEEGFEKKYSQVTTGGSVFKTLCCFVLGPVTFETFWCI